MDVKVVREIIYFNTRKLSGHIVCSCEQWMESGEGLQGNCIHSEALEVILKPVLGQV